MPSVRAPSNSMFQAKLADFITIQVKLEGEGGEVLFEFLPEAASQNLISKKKEKKTAEGCQNRVKQVQKV